MITSVAFINCSVDLDGIGIPIMKSDFSSTVIKIKLLPPTDVGIGMISTCTLSPIFSAGGESLDFSDGAFIFA